MILSVIVPVYKTEKYLKRCIDSILNQTYSNLEVILIDDGSPDHCPDICDQYARNDLRVKVVHKTNGGVASARNVGLDIATGDYFTFVDSDDYIDINMYQSMINIVKKYDCDIVMCDCIKEYNTHSEIYSHNIRSGYYNKKQLEVEYYSHLIIMENVDYPPTISNCLCLFRKKNKYIRYFNGVRHSEDWLFGIQMMIQADSFYYMKNKCYYHYFMNDQSATHIFSVDKWNDYMIIYNETLECFKKYNNKSFTSQINLMLLFFIYNAVGDIIRTDQLELDDKLKRIEDILTTRVVRQVFKKIRVNMLPIPFKQKVQTYMYKYNFGIKYLCKRKE